MNKQQSINISHPLFSNLMSFFVFFPQRSYQWKRHYPSFVWSCRYFLQQNLPLCFSSPFFKRTETAQSHIKTGQKGIWCHQKVCLLFLFHQLFHIIWLAAYKVFLSLLTSHQLDCSNILQWAWSISMTKKLFGVGCNYSFSADRRKDTLAGCTTTNFQIKIPKCVWRLMGTKKWFWHRSDSTTLLNLLLPSLFQMRQRQAIKSARNKCKCQLITGKKCFIIRDFIYFIYHKIIESLNLERISKIIKSILWLNITMPSKPYK